MQSELLHTKYNPKKKWHKKEAAFLDSLLSFKRMYVIT